VTSVKVYDQNSAVTIIAASGYIVDATTEPGRLVIKSSTLAPLVGQAARGIEIDFVAGYGSLMTDVPVALRQTVLQVVKVLYGRDGGASGGGSVQRALRYAEFFKIKRV
jgi:uncharacterized phiE125 gp8 family phage protein